jgi:hypothetical protein
MQTEERTFKMSAKFVNAIESYAENSFKIFVIDDCVISGFRRFVTSAFAQHRNHVLLAKFQ